MRLTWNNLLPLTNEQKAKLKALSEMPDSEIDYSDIPPQEDAFWENAVHKSTQESLYNCTKPGEGVSQILRRAMHK